MATLSMQDTIYSDTVEGAFVSGFFFLVSRAPEPSVHGFQLLAVSWSALVTIVEDQAEAPFIFLGSIKSYPVLHPYCSAQMR